jgi:SPP1 family predicted phage head-tail adaptor
MDAGKLRHRVTIESPSTARDEFNEPVPGWNTVADAWASREDLTGRELFQAQAVAAEVTTRFRLRYADGIKAEMRLLCGGEAFDIKSVADPDGRRRELIILATRAG